MGRRDIEAASVPQSAVTAAKRIVQAPNHTLLLTLFVHNATFLLPVPNSHSVLSSYKQPNMMH